MAVVTITEKASAKINLYLDILGIRDDGFHEIETLMQTISLSDELIFTHTQVENSTDRLEVALVIDGNDALVRDERNLVIRAIREYEKHRPIGGKLDVILKKRIPTEAGLGGGSADAAATLRALNRLADEPLGDSALHDMASILGSDVPFCLRGGTCICRGRGELLSDAEPIKGLHLVVVNSGERVSTPKAYSALDSVFGDFTRVPGRIGVNTAYSCFKMGKYDPFNIFEDVVLPACPLAKEAKEKLLSLGASMALMSGSGPTVFGIFEDENAAICASEALSAFGFCSFVAESI